MSAIYNYAFGVRLARLAGGGVSVGREMAGRGIVLVLGVFESPTQYQLYSYPISTLVIERSIMTSVLTRLSHLHVGAI